MPSNVLVLDEPTNDLDTETLGLLEERLLTYSGTILLVSHDRAFLNNVVTSTMVFEDDGRLREYAGGYDDWLRQRRGAPGAGRGAGREEAAPRRGPAAGRGAAREAAASGATGTGAVPAGRRWSAARRRSASSPSRRPRSWRRCLRRSKPWKRSGPGSSPPSVRRSSMPRTTQRRWWLPTPGWRRWSWSSPGRFPGGRCLRSWAADRRHEIEPFESVSQIPYRPKCDFCLRSTSPRSSHKGLTRSAGNPLECWASRADLKPPSRPRKGIPWVN